MKSTSKLVFASIVASLFIAGCNKGETENEEPSLSEMSELAGGVGGADVAMPTVDETHVYFRDASAERREAFINALAEALTNFKELQHEKIKISASPATDSVEIQYVGEDNARRFKDIVAIATTNFAIKYPGIGFYINDEGWSIKVGEETVIPLEEDLSLAIP